ncbi:MAG: hypothetical protein ACOC80_15185 [Petrotogales bacterium]
MFTYADLNNNLKKGLRNGNWKKLNKVQKAFYRASLSYSRFQGKIVNSNITGQISSLVEMLLETPGIRVLKKGYEKAAELIQKYEEEGVFDWAPQLRFWLNDPDYIKWLAICST